MATRLDLANALRVLAMDAVEAAASGHPGAPMGMADMAEALWRGFLKHNPADTSWPDRDRFVLSNGHASMLLYGLLHLTGYDVSMDDIRAFRQLGSKTPGHPECGVTPGVEMTTGPLGQGLATAVGMALAERVLAATFNREGFPVVDHRTWVFVGDGCLMEGLSQEACSLAGTLGLGKLTVLYDDNNISIDGPVKSWFADDTPARFEACGWHVIRGVGGNDADDVDEAIRDALSVTDKPSLICCRTVIGYGSPRKAGTASCHGSPLGAEEVEQTKKALGWEHPPFTIPQDIASAWDARARGAAAQAAWDDMMSAYRAEYPDLAAEFDRRMAGRLPENWPDVVRAAVDALAANASPVATRVAGKNTLDVLAPALPELLGGSADLTGSVGTRHNASRTLGPGAFEGNYLYYGVREFGMGAVMNGLALHGGFIPYGGTFLIFSDYAKNIIRLAALMKQRVVWVLTHDSIGVGEDGPTHQPVEQLASLRMIPGMDVWRPCDGLETAVAWTAAIERADGPTSLSLSRQNLKPQPDSPARREGARRGGYILRDCEGAPEALLLATGSEVELAVAAAERLSAAGRRVRVVSMPCNAVFDRQDAAWREAVLPSSVRARVAVEAAATDWWWKYVGLDGRVAGMTTFGESGPAKAVFEHFGFTVDHVARLVEESLA